MAAECKVIRGGEGFHGMPQVGTRWDAQGSRPHD